MKVYILMRVIKYEGEEITAIFTNARKAQTVLRKLKADFGDVYYLEEHDANSFEYGVKE